MNRRTARIARHKPAGQSPRLGEEDDHQAVVHVVATEHVEQLDAGHGERLDAGHGVPVTVDPSAPRDLRCDDAPWDGDAAVEHTESWRGADDDAEPASADVQPSVATSTPESSSRHSCQNASGAAMPASAATTGSHRGKPPRRDRLLYGGERVHDPGSRRCGGPCSPGETLVGYPCPALMPGIGVGEEISRRPAVAAGLAIRTGTTRLDGDPRPAGPRHRVPHKGPRDRRGIRPPG